MKRALILLSACLTLSVHGLAWRGIGPFRGGRTVAATGVPQQPNVFYIGVNNGGVWKTNDYGLTWKPIFDDQPTGSIGALAIAPSDPNILYVGSGEGLQRPDLSVGDGVYKSTDGGKTWRHAGLRDGQQISALVVDPRDARRVFVAVDEFQGGGPRGVGRLLPGHCQHSRAEIHPHHALTAQRPEHSHGGARAATEVQSRGKGAQRRQVFTYSVEHGTRRAERGVIKLRREQAIS